MTTRVILKCLGCELPLCNVCNVCHTPGCKYGELRVTTLEERAKYRAMDAKTQKVRGFVRLKQDLNLNVPLPYFLVLEKADIKAVIGEALLKGMQTIFVRPCPVRARHGFEESRPVKFDALQTLEENNIRLVAEIEAIWDAAQAADEEHSAELLLLPFIDSSYNAIITPSRVAVGPNHDGATSGYDSVSFPLMGVPFMELKENPSVLQLAGIKPDEDPYFEVVYQGAGAYPLFTQMRSGVRLATDVGADYVPESFRVRHVVEASGDLLEWEKQVKELKPGTVVVKPGGTLISHYGVHCLYNKVACFTSRIPVVGEVLTKVGVSPEPDVKAVSFGLGVGALIPLDINSHIDGGLEMSQALIAMMSILHNAGAMNGEHSFWTGFGASIMMRAGMAASHGEARHKLQDLGSLRNFVYKLALQDFMGARNTIGTAQWMFTNLAWSSSYGGQAWGRCTASVIEMERAAQKLLKDGSKDDVKGLVSAFNVAVNQAHNGGWWLNKFILQQFFEHASKQSVNSIATTAMVMYRVKKLYPNITPEITALLDQWREAEPVEVKPGGKLQIQVDNPEFDQTAFSETVKKAQFKSTNKTIKSNYMPVTNEVFAELTAHISAGKLDYSVCIKCNHMFNFTLTQIPHPIICGFEGCDGLVGIWGVGSKYIKYKMFVPAAKVADVGDGEEDLSEEDQDESWSEPVETEDVPDKGDGDTVSSAPVAEWNGQKAPDGYFFSSGVESVPPLKKNGVKAKYQNITGFKLPTKGVSEAQANFSWNGSSWYLHLQYRTAMCSPMQYFSINAEVKLTSNQLDLIKKGSMEPLVSWSGSGVANYWPVGISKQDEAIYDLSVGGLGIYLRLEMPNGKLTQMVEKEEPSGEVESEVKEEVILDEIPF